MPGTGKKGKGTLDLLFVRRKQRIVFLNLHYFVAITTDREVSLKQIERQSHPMPSIFYTPAKILFFCHVIYVNNA